MNTKFSKISKLFMAVLAAVVVLMQNPYTLVFAYDIPIAPSAPTTPSAPEAPSAPTTPSAPEAPSLSESTPPEEPEAPTLNESQEQSSEEEEESNNEENNYGASNEGLLTNTDSTENENDSSADYSGQVNDGNVGDTHLTTGDATNSSVVTTSANNNLSSDPDSDSGSVIVGNSENGSASNNSGSASIVNNNNTYQDNDANVSNNLDQSTNTGSNSASNNVGNSEIKTGDANTTATVVNSVNTNVDGVMVAEFNVAEDHVGDIILDFNSSCVSGCSSDINVANESNGAGSNNSGEVNLENNDNTFQTNDAVLENNVTLDSNSGNNATDANTGGNSSITTGDANTQASVLNFANNNFAGEVVYAVVNIFGNLIGDIIFPDGSTLSCCTSDLLAKNAGNGSGSTNNSAIDQANNDNTFQTNDADIENNILVSATTGDNNVSENTGGDNRIITGDTNILAQVLNVANLNLTGGNYWLVLVNEAGHWIGRILGAPDGSNVGGSEAFSFIVDESGEISVINSDNGSGSENNAAVSEENNTNIYQTNNAKIVNNLNLSANTGGNSASRNTGGESSVTTGDANIVANIVNFVNNNIVGTGKLFVTVVNVFGGWVGDFVSPGHTKENESQNNNAGIGGSQSEQSTNSSGIQSGNQQGETTGTTSLSFVTNKVKKLSYILGGGTMTLGTTTEGLVTNENTDTSIGAASQTVAGKKVVKVNLAYLVFLLPIIMVVLIVRRKVYSKIPARI